MEKVILTKEIAQAILFEDVYEDNPNYGKVISDVITGKSRWSDKHTLVIQYQGKLLRGNYSEGSTESQEERAWEYDDEVEFEEVEAYERTIIDYRPIA